MKVLPKPGNQLNWAIRFLKHLDSFENAFAYTVKDNFCVKNVPQTCASKNEWTPSYTSDCVKRLGIDGLMATTNMDEFSSGSNSNTGFHGPVFFPKSGTPLNAGSSGGSAVSCCLGYEVSLGTDTGGSVRHPAASTNIYGFKPSYDAISRKGIVAFASSLDTVGIFSKSIDTIEATFQKLRNNSLSSRQVSIRRVGFYKTKPFSLENYESDECSLSIPSLLELSNAAYIVISSVELMSNLLRFSGILKDVNPQLKGRILAANVFMTAEPTLYRKACVIRRILYNELNNKAFNIIVTPCNQQFYPIANLTGRPAIVTVNHKYHLIGQRDYKKILQIKNPNDYQISMPSESSPGWNDPPPLSTIKRTGSRTIFNAARDRCALNSFTGGETIQSGDKHRISVNLLDQPALNSFTREEPIQSSDQLGISVTLDRAALNCFAERETTQPGCLNHSNSSTLNVNMLQPILDQHGISQCDFNNRIKNVLDYVNQPSIPSETRHYINLMMSAMLSGDISTARQHRHSFIADTHLAFLLKSIDPLIR
ncbi:hypothetical protein GJ496_006561 [Pomphorhynchus laevis]|nr:hypothetical protein GJ496_006561 [Pomphorhynchus laevis]